MEDLNMALAIYGFFAPAPRKVECAGIAYECNLIRDRISLGQSPGRALNGENSLSKCSSTNSSSADLSSQENLDNFMDKDDEKYYKYISKLDPNNFKDQDHYRVLGLSSLRYKATMGQIKAACKYL
jgi:DnaJ family protein C protein 2